MQLEKTKIEGVHVFNPKAYEDHRGVFFELFNRSSYENAGLVDDFVQDNCSYSRKGVIRGLHYQVGEYAQGKLAFVLSGKVLDVAVDLREGSPTYGQHVAVELSSQNKRQLWIPPGFAHGMSVLSDEAVFAYKCTKPYSPRHDRAIRYCDPDLGIDWRVASPVISEKDSEAPFFKDIKPEFSYG